MGWEQFLGIYLTKTCMIVSHKRELVTGSGKVSDKIWS